MTAGATMVRWLALAAIARVALGDDWFDDCQPEGCIFPFVYYDVTYEACTDVGANGKGSWHYPWCADAVKDDGITYDNSWLECEASNCHAPTPRPTPRPTVAPSADPAPQRVVVLSPAPSSPAPSSEAPSRAPSLRPTNATVVAANAVDDDGIVLIASGGVAWSRSKKRSVWYQWILRSLGVLALGLLAVLEPILVVAESRVSDKQKRTMLLLSVCDTAFVICFLIELWYTRRVLFYVEVSVLTCAALSSAALLVRLRVVAPGLDLPADPRKRRLLLVIAGFVTLDPELIPLLPWRANARDRDDEGVVRLKRIGLKHFARSFPTVFSSRVSLALDLAKHGVTAVASVLALLAPSADSVIEFATLAASLASVCANGYRRYVLLRRSDEPPAPDEGKPRSSTGAASPVAFTPNPLSPAGGSVELPEAPPSTRRTSARASRTTPRRLGSGKRRSSAWRFGTPPLAKADETKRGEWTSAYTDEGHLYYHNTATGESSWEPPLV